MMTDPATVVEEPTVLPPVDHGMSISIALTITLVSLVAVAWSTYAVVGQRLSTGMTRLLAVVSLIAFVAMVYGLIELALAVIATTSERRRKAREVSERRQGARARKPRDD